MEAAVKLNQICKDYQVGDSSSRVLFDLTTEMNMGELTMLVGPSGSGKTTMISIISGILSPTKGSVEIMGQTLTDMSDTQRVLFRRKNIGFIFQQFNLLPALTAAENAAMPLIAAGYGLDEATACARATLASMGMSEHAEKLPAHLSGGQQQRVAIARALVHDPGLILCDEPTSALDTKTGLAVIQLLRKIADKKNRAIILVTHDNRIYEYGDKIIEISDGRIIGRYTAREFIKKEKL
ncbi:MAG: ABC transporter ATP-binding protein [Proteobacteria bacterium]|nr:ABC transporter ATP-binding protein [Pseudomonadota bacterium]